MMDKNSDAILKDVMQSEWVRLSSFANFPLKSPVHTTRLAEAGFYYQNKEDEVKCFSCGSKYSGWKEGDIPKYIHQNISPHCRFITGSQSGNVSVKESQKKYVNGESSSTASNPSCVENVSSSKPSYGACGHNDDLPESNIKSGKEITTNKSVTSRRSSAGNNNGRQRTEYSCKSPTETTPNGIQNQHVHGEHSGAELVSNTLDQGIRRGNPSQQFEPACQHNNIEPPLGICTQRPVYPHYAITTVRMTSFRNWPKSKKQNPQDLAKAGFFYEGTEDRVRCFFCGGGLVNWDPEDDPWIEHARWYPKCVYLRQNKGDNFILRVQEAAERGQVDLSYLKDQEDRRNPPDMMSHAAVVSVLDMGVSIDLVKKALSLLPLSTLSAEKLLLKVWEIEDKETKQSGQAEAVTDTHLGAKNGDNEDTETASNVNTAELSQANEKLQSNETSKTNEEERIAIMEENRYLKELQLCKICLDEDVSIVFLPCGHMASCASCAPALRKCPICRTFIKGTVKAILS